LHQERQGVRDEKAGRPLQDVESFQRMGWWDKEEVAVGELGARAKDLACRIEVIAVERASPAPFEKPVTEQLDVGAAKQHGLGFGKDDEPGKGREVR
jgi:hypothetical protein